MFVAEDIARYNYYLETPSPPDLSPFSDAENSPPNYVSSTYPHGRVMLPTITDMDFAQSLTSSPTTNTPVSVPAALTATTTTNTSLPLNQTPTYEDTLIFPESNLDQRPLYKSISSTKQDSSIIPSAPNKSNAFVMGCDGANSNDGIRRPSAPVNQVDECKQQSPQEMDEAMEVEPETFLSAPDTQTSPNMDVQSLYRKVATPIYMQGQEQNQWFQNQPKQSTFHTQNTQASHPRVVSFSYQSRTSQSQAERQQNRDYLGNKSASHSGQPLPPACKNGNRTFRF